jgi:hypothetical protein
LRCVLAVCVEGRERESEAVAACSLAVLIDTRNLKKDRVRLSSEFVESNQWRRTTATCSIRDYSNREKKTMASIYLSICSTSKPLAAPPKSAGRTTASASSSSSCFKSQFCGWFLAGRLVCSGSRKQKKQMQVVSMAPDEEKLTRRSPLDFPIVLLSLYYYFYLFWNCRVKEYY